MPPNWVHKYVDVGTPLEVNGLKNIWETWHANRRTSIINPLVCEFVDQSYWNQMKIPTITEERMLGMNMIVNEIPIKVWLVPSPYKDLFNLTFFKVVLTMKKMKVAILLWRQIFRSCLQFIAPDGIFLMELIIMPSWSQDQLHLEDHGD